jgi:hypothetical protein
MAAAGFGSGLQLRKEIAAKNSPNRNMFTRLIMIIFTLQTQR